ncbi:MAG: hydroxyethylthiazole kinase [Desulfobulbus sp.]|jgi:hydroxyethylthiazole kinase
MTDLADTTAKNLTLLRETRPLVHSITNLVVMHLTANVLLAAGASPVMAHAENEVAEMVGHAGALVLNIGTLDDRLVQSMRVAGKQASSLNKPVVLDPVGAGATTLRTATAHNLLQEVRVGIVRGNASEILALARFQSGGRGVDAADSVADAAEAARNLARRCKTVVAVTGPEDLVTDGTRRILVRGGHALMPLVSGTGCSASVLTAAFHAVDPDPLSAAASALAFFGVAGELAGKRSPGPGTFMTNLLDALYTLSPDEVRSRCRITELDPT